MKLKQTPYYQTYKPKLSSFIIERTTCIRRNYKYIYFRIPKAANTMITSNLYLNENGVFNITSEELNQYKVNFERPSSLADDEIRDFENYFKFTVVRNPATRILSCYLQKILGNAKEKNIVTKDIGVEDDAYLSFEEFLDWLGSEGNIRKNYHWALQVDLIPIGIEALDFVGKVETLDTDLDLILDRIFGKDRERKSIDFSPGKTHANEKQDEYFTPGIRKKILKLYQDDFDSFEYRFAD